MDLKRKFLSYGEKSLIIIVESRFLPLFLLPTRKIDLIGRGCILTVVQRFLNNA